MLTSANLVRAIPAILIACALLGCAGIIAPFVNNPYAGTYNGAFSTSDGKAGPATISLTNIGNVFGNLTNSATNTAGTLNGSVGTSLVFNGTVVFPGSSQSVTGTMKSSNGLITGTLDGADGYTITLDMTSKN